MRSIAIRSVPALAILVLLACSSSMSMQETVARHSGSTVAVVSVSANNFGDSLQGWNSANSSELMGSRVAKMLAAAERELGAKWKIVPADRFVGKKAFQAERGGHFDVGLAKLKNGTLPVFAQDRDQLIEAGLTPSQAQTLTQVTGANLVAVIYSEWAVATGKFVPTAKALTKNVLSIYDANGQRVYHGRKDVVGAKTLGALGRVSVTDTTIDQWVDSYEVALATLMR